MPILISCILALMVGLFSNAAGAGPGRAIQWTVNMGGVQKTVQVYLVNKGKPVDYTKALRKAFGKIGEKQHKTKVFSHIYLENSGDGNPHVLDPFYDQLVDALGTTEVFAPRAVNYKWVRNWLGELEDLSSVEEVWRLDFAKMRRIRERLDRQGEFTLESLERNIRKNKEKAEVSLQEFSSKWNVPVPKLWQGWVNEFEEGYVVRNWAMDTIRPSDEQKVLPYDIFYASVMNQKGTRELNQTFRKLNIFILRYYMWGEQFELLSEMLNSIENKDHLIFFLDERKFTDADSQIRLFRDLLGRVNELNQVSISGNPISPRNLRLFLTGEYSAGCQGCARKGHINRREKMQVCSGCRVARYCSPECQKGDWPIHKSECGKRETQTGQNPTQSGSTDQRSKKKRRSVKSDPSRPSSPAPQPSKDDLD